MANPNVSVAFSYTTDPLVMATLKEFHVYPVDPTTRARQTATALVVSKTSIPTSASPLIVPMTGYGTQMIEVVPIDIEGKEGVPTYGSMYIILPAVTSIAQVTK